MADFIQEEMKMPSSSLNGRDCEFFNDAAIDYNCACNCAYNCAYNCVSMLGVPRKSSGISFVRQAPIAHPLV
jgi:hypothetical protein